MTTGQAIVEARRLTKNYVRGPETVEAIRELDLTIERGEMLAITGESGSGKTTLLHLLGCIDRPTRGRLEVAGTAVEGLPERAMTDLRRRVVGFVFQEFSLLPALSLSANVALPLMFGGGRGAPRGEERVAALLDRVGLAHRARFRPRDVSGGELQRAAIARALVRRPSLLLADEPTGNLDARNTTAVFELFRELNARDGLTVVVVTHSEDLARLCPRRLHLVDGRLTG